MCDRVKIFLDSIRNGEYFGSRQTGRILNPVALLGALINKGYVGPATAIASDYMVAEKAGIIQVSNEPNSSKAFMKLRQKDTVSKVYEIVTSGTVQPGAGRMAASHMSDGTSFKSIEQGQTEFQGVSRELAELENEIIKNLREA